MKSQANQIRLQFNSEMKPEIIITLKSREGLESLDELKTVIDKGKSLDVEIKPHREKRSQDSNGYLWALLGKMAAALNTSKDELYLHMLKRYGKYTYAIVKTEAVEMFTSMYRLTEEVGKTKNGEGTQLLCYFGSSLYDSKEMATLINGVVSEAKEIGIETMTPSEIEQMNSQWNKEKT